MIKKRV